MSSQRPDDIDGTPVGGPVPVAWREGTLTRAKELEALADWMHQLGRADPARVDGLRSAIARHLEAARDAAEGGRRRRTGSRLERAISNLDAAEADLLQIASPEYLVGELPSVLNTVQRHLKATDPRRTEIERIAERLGATLPEQASQVEQERRKIVSAMRGASSAGLREQTRVRSFRNVLVLAIVAMAVLAVVMAGIGVWNPSAIPLCFAPEEAGMIRVVCPIQQSGPMAIEQDAAVATVDDIDTVVGQTVKWFDILVVELLGLIAASVAAAAAIRGVRGSSEPYGVPLALAVLKLPTGALTAVMGLLLMRGEFVPGLSALDTSAQILAWAIVFGYSQQLFTRLIDQQGHTVLDGVRSGNKGNESDRST